MKNIERGTIKYLIIIIILTAVFGFILYPLFDFISCKLITNSTFVYSINKHIVQPLIFAVIYGITYWSIDKKKSK